MSEWATNRKTRTKFPRKRLPKSIAPLKLPEQKEIAAYVPFTPDSSDTTTIVIDPNMTGTQKSGGGYFSAPRKTYKDPDEALQDVLMEIKVQTDGYPENIEWSDLATGEAASDPENLSSWNKQPEGWKTTGAHFHGTSYDSKQGRYWSVSGSVLRTKRGNWIADAEVEDITEQIA